MKPIAILNKDFDGVLRIEYIIGTLCNYKCHNCYDGCNDGKYRFPTDFNMVTKNLSHMLKIYKEHLGKQNVRINLTGGEPSLWPELGEFAEYFSKNHDCKISIVTNASRTMRFWMEYAKYFDDISISVHNEFADVDHIIEVMDWVFYNTDVLINAQVLMDPLHWDRCVEIAEKMKAHPTPWVLKTKPIFTDGEIKGFTPEQIAYTEQKMKKIPPVEWIQKQRDLGRIQDSKSDMRVVMDSGEEIPADTFKVIQNGWHYFTGWDCNLGVDRFAIERDGVISGSCGARNMFGGVNRFSIYDPEFESKFTPDVITTTRCQQLYCNCPTEVKIPKRKLNV